MSYKILTKNAVENTNIDGARDHFFNSGNQDGLVKGALNEGTLTVSSNSIILDTCELRISGHRVVVTSSETTTIPSVPATTQRMSLIAQIIVSSDSTPVFSVFAQQSSIALIKNNLFKTISGAGTYQIELAKFTQSSTGVLSNLVKTVPVISIGGAPEIVQETGQSTEKTMSQKAITDAINAGGGAVYSVIEISTSQTVLTDEQYNTLIASPFNKIKFGNIICDLYQETSTELVYTANYFNNGHRVTITKATKGVTRGSLSSLTSISSYVKNSLDYNQSNTTYALSAYQGKVLNDRLIALENSGGGGGSGSASDGFNNLKVLNLTPMRYQGTESPSGKFAFRGAGGYTLKDNISRTITTIVQLPVVPGEGIRFAETADGHCEISATGGESKPILVLNTSEAQSFTNHYGRTYYAWPAVDAAGINNHEYNVIIYDQTSGGGYYYCPLTSDDMTWIGQARPTGDTSSSDLVGWAYKGRESETVASFWRDEWSKQPTNALYLHNLTISSDYENISTAVYSSQSTQFDLPTFISKYSGSLCVNGEFTTQSKQYFIPKMLVKSSGTIEVYYLNGTTRTSKTITPTLITDVVKEV